VVEYDFDGYGEDIGTTRLFYDTNLVLDLANLPFNYLRSQTFHLFLSGFIIWNSRLEGLLLAEGFCNKSACIG
jgi:hypothetical protein